MANFTITNHFVFPSVGDVHGGIDGSGRAGDEKTLKEVFDRGNRVVSGFTIPSSGSRTCQIAAGIAIINGYEVSGFGPIDVTFDDATAMLWVWLVLTKDIGNFVNGCKIQTNTTDAVVTDGVLLGRVTTSGGNITARVDTRSAARKVWGVFEYRTSGAQYRYIVGSSDWNVVNGSGSNIRINFSVPFARAPSHAQAWKTNLGAVPTFLSLADLTTTYVEFTLVSPANLDLFAFEITV